MKTGTVLITITPAPSTPASWGFVVESHSARASWRIPSTSGAASGRNDSVVYGGAGFLLNFWRPDSDAPRIICQEISLILISSVTKVDQAVLSKTQIKPQMLIRETGAPSS